MKQAHWQAEGKNTSTAVLSRTVKEPAAGKTAASAPLNYAALLQGFGDQAMALITASGRCIALSPNWRDVTTLPAESCIEDGLWGYLHRDFHDKLRHRLAMNPEPDSGTARLRCQIRGGGTGWQWFDLRVVDVTREAGIDEPVMHCLLRNITPTIHTEQRMQRAFFETELALRGRSEFLAHMSHELRTPLNAIVGFTQIIEQELFGAIENERYREYIANIQDSGYTLLDRINDLLELSMIETGRVELNEEDVDVVALIRNALEIHTHHAFSSRIILQEPSFRGTVLMRLDRLKIKQAVSNLIANALRYTPAGGTVKLSLTASISGVSITVHDTGCGIAANQLRSMHDAFGQADAFYARTTNGLGLGLSIANEYVQLHGGTLAIDSKSGTGTTATVTLPGDRMLHASEESTKPARKKAPSKKPAKSRKKST